MTTKIELSGERLNQWLVKNSERTFCYLPPVRTTFLIAEVPDESGVYDTPFGKLGLRFGPTMDGNIVRHAKSPAVMLNCEDIKLLQARTNRRYRRTVNINREGIGFQQLDKGVNVVITTDANLDEFRGLEND